MMIMTSGNPRLSSTGTLSVIVEDENDNPPKFSQAQYTVSLEENSEPNTLVTTITATDPDIGLNSLLTYSLRGEDASRFSISPDTGEVRSRWSLDREEKEEYVVVVDAEDQGRDVRLSASCLLTGRVTDVNDNQPEVSINYFSFFELGIVSQEGFRKPNPNLKNKQYKYQNVHIFPP